MTDPSNPASTDPEIMTIKAGILARTPEGHRFRFAVVGQDEAEARRLFDEALERVEKLAVLTEERLRAEASR